MKRYAFVAFCLATCLMSGKASAQQELYSEPPHPGVTLPTVWRENTTLQPFASHTPYYPVDALARYEEGHIVVAVTVTKEGYPINCRVISRNDPIFNAPSLEYCSSLRYHPATKNGAPIDYLGHIMHVNYVLSHKK